LLRSPIARAGDRSSIKRLYLECIHYLLVAGFDVYGNIGHQLSTRLYMDFLRMESEFGFLALLPEETRIAL